MSSAGARENSAGPLRSPITSQFRPCSRACSASVRMHAVGDWMVVTTMVVFSGLMISSEVEQDAERFTECAAPDADLIVHVDDRDLFPAEAVHHVPDLGLEKIRAAAHATL